jgi:hypothetical protein
LVFAGSAEENAERERELLLAFVSRRVDGLIVITVGDDQIQGVQPDVRYLTRVWTAPASRRAAVATALP